MGVNPSKIIEKPQVSQCFKMFSSEILSVKVASNKGLCVSHGTWCPGPQNKPKINKQNRRLRRALGFVWFETFELREWMKSWRDCCFQNISGFFYKKKSHLRFLCFSRFCCKSGARVFGSHLFFLLLRASVRPRAARQKSRSRPLSTRPSNRKSVNFFGESWMLVHALHWLRALLRPTDVTCELLRTLALLGQACPPLGIHGPLKFNNEMKTAVERATESLF